VAKVSRKELLKKEDAFLAAANQSAQWLKKHRTAVVVGVVAAFVLIAAIVGGGEYVAKRDATASGTLAEARKLLEANVLGEELADPTGDPPTFATDEDKWKAAKTLLERSISEAGSSGVGVLARFFAADVDAKLGEADKAEAAFLDLADSLGRDDSLYFLAVERAAYMQEARGNIDGAIQTLDRLIGGSASFYGDRARYHQARLLIGQEKNDRARNLLQSIELEYPESTVTDDVRRLLGKLPGAALEEQASADSNAEVTQ